MTTTTTPKPTPAPRVTRSARPGPPAPKLIWSNGRIELNRGKTMTARQACDYVRNSWTNHGARSVKPGCIETTHLSDRTTTIWTGTLPLPEDPHAAVTDFETLLLDFPLGIGQGDLLIAAMRAAVDGIDPTPLLLRLIASTVVQP